MLGVDWAFVARSWRSCSRSRSASPGPRPDPRGIDEPRQAIRDGSRPPSARPTDDLVGPRPAPPGARRRRPSSSSTSRSATLVPRRPHGRRHRPSRRRAASRAREHRGAPASSAGRPGRSSAGRRWRRSSTPGSRRSRARPRHGLAAAARSRRSAGRTAPTLVDPGPALAGPRRLARPRGRRRSCAASSRSGPSSSTTSRTSCGRRSRRSASSPRRWPATPRRAGDAVPAEDARPDREDRGRDRPPRPDGQRAARPRPDRERRPAVLLDDVDIGPGRRASPPSGSGSSPSARACASCRRPPDLPPGPRRRGPDRPGRRQPRSTTP